MRTRNSGSKRARTRATETETPRMSIDKNVTSLKKTKFADLKVGDFLSETQYYSIIKKTETDVTVKNERDFTLTIPSEIVEEGSYTASQFTETRSATLSDIVRVFKNAKDTVFTVRFRKQPNEAHVLEILANLTAKDLKDQKFMRSVSRRVTRGEERTLVGYLVDSEPKLGRSRVIDLKLGEIRLVDHRSILWIIHKNILYKRSDC